MVVSRNISLSISLTGDLPVKRILTQLQTQATKLQQTLSNITINGNNVNSSKLSIQNDVLGSRFLSPIDKTIADVKGKNARLKDELQNVATPNTLIDSLNNSVARIKQNSKIDLVIKLTGYDAVRSQLLNLQKYADELKTKLNFNINVNSNSKINNISNNLNSQIINPITNTVSNVGTQRKRLISEISGINNLDLTGITRLNNLKSISLDNFKNTAIGTGHFNPEQSILSSNNKKASIDSSLESQRVITSDFRSLGNYAFAEADAKRLADETKITAERAKQIKLGEMMAAKNKQMQQDELNRIKNIYKVQEQKMDDIQQKAKSLVQTGFGLHIVQIYIAPILYGLEQISAKIISTFSQFDKLYQSYQVKSEGYGEWLSKSNFYSASIGQTFGIQDSAIAAERFAASGVDVAKSQQALTSVMQVATAANMDYADAANSVIKTMQAMHMDVSQTTEITDALINSANASTAELSDLTQWFEYSASSAYQMGLSVKQLSAYLGILASSGTPNTGAAMRQLFLQLSKEDIQKNIKGKFSQITDEDFANISQFISKMREYVKTSDDQKAATLEITRLLGGKANAQQALQNLLVAEPKLWNQVTNAVNESGSTQDLYNKITNNAADAIKRMQVNLEIILTQLGESFGPALTLISKFFTMFTNAFVSLPSFVKSILGYTILLATAIAAVSFIIIGVIGALAIMAGTTSMLASRETLLIGVTQNWSTVLRKLMSEIYTVAFAGNSLSTMFGKVTTSATTSATAIQTLSNRQNVLNSILSGAAGGFMGYMVGSSLAQKQMFGEAKVVGFLTSMWLSYNAAKAASILGPVAAVTAGLAVGVGYNALVYDQIETMKNNNFNSAMNKQISGYTTVNKKTTVNIANANISSDGMDIDDLISATDSGDFSDDY
jgi:TP901 family phage tail tape measure protein